MIKKLKHLFKKDKQTIWELPVESKKAIDDSIADFILSQADKALNYTLDIADKTTNRAYAVILLVIPLTSTIASLLITELNSDKKVRNIHKIGLFESLTLLCILALILLLKIVLPRLTMGSGRAPKDMAHDNMLQNENPPERKLLLFKLNEIKNAQHKIDYNNRLNRKRIFRFKLVLIILCIGFIGGAMVYAMI